MTRDPHPTRRPRRLGRPPIATAVSQLPTVTLPTAVHDAVIQIARRRGVSVAAVVREALISHLKTRQVTELTPTMAP